MNQSNADNNKFADIQFRISDSCLVADFKQNELDQPLIESIIIERLNSAGFGRHMLTDEMLADLISSSTFNQTETITIGEHKNGKFEIILEDDQLRAFIDYSPAVYGKPVTEQEVIDALNALGVNQQYVNLSSIEKAIREDVLTKFLVAEGEPPVSGDDAYFELLFDTGDEKDLKEDGIDRVDHYETRSYVQVEENQPVLRKVPATLGKHGKSVFGEDISPEPGVDKEFILDDSVKIAEDDENLLLAVITGHPIYEDNVIRIDETLSIDGASLETGNIRFDGSVQIKGDVKPNVVVEAKGDLFIEGLVENATLIAGNTITIKAGVISSRLYEDDEIPDDATYRPGCRLVATKDIYLTYCNSVHAVAEGSIYIENYALHSVLEAGNAIIAGINNGNGVLLGGKSKAEEVIEANTVGSDAYVPTRLVCAEDNELMRNLHRKSVRIERMKDELNMLNNVLNTIKQLGTPDTVSPMQLKKAKKVFAEIKENKRELKAQRNEISQIKQILAASHRYRIKINKTCFPNVRIRVNDVEMNNKKTRKACTIDLVDNELNFN